MKVSLIVCDVCRDPSKEAASYRVTSNGRAASTDRCAEHGQEFEAVLKERADAPARRRGRPVQSKVTSMEEIEAKKAAKRAASTSA